MDIDLGEDSASMAMDYIRLPPSDKLIVLARFANPPEEYKEIKEDKGVNRLIVLLLESALNDYRGMVDVDCQDLGDGCSIKSEVVEE